MGKGGRLMRIEPIAVTKREIGAIVLGSFPEYRGRKFRLYASETVILSDLNWSGGTRSQYRAVTLDGFPVGNTDKYNQVAPWNNPAEGQVVPIPQGIVVVEHVLFCGKDLGLKVWANPADMPKLLPPNK
jgi:hypothetical protein